MKEGGRREGRGETGRNRKPNWFGHRQAVAGAGSVCHTQFNPNQIESRVVTFVTVSYCYDICKFKRLISESDLNAMACLTNT